MHDGYITQEELFRVLKAYSVLNPVEGYCQAQVRIVIVIIFFVIIVTPNIMVATIVITKKLVTIPSLGANGSSAIDTHAFNIVIPKSLTLLLNNYDFRRQ